MKALYMLHLLVCIFMFLWELNGSDVLFTRTKNGFIGFTLNKESQFLSKKFDIIVDTEYFGVGKDEPIITVVSRKKDNKKKFQIKNYKYCILREFTFPYAAQNISHFKVSADSSLLGLYTGVGDNKQLIVYRWNTAKPIYQITCKLNDFIFSDDSRHLFFWHAEPLKNEFSISSVDLAKREMKKIANIKSFKTFSQVLYPIQVFCKNLEHGIWIKSYTSLKTPLFFTFTEHRHLTRVDAEEYYRASTSIEYNDKIFFLLSKGHKEKLFSYEDILRDDNVNIIKILISNSKKYAAYMTDKKMGLFLYDIETKKIHKLIEPAFSDCFFWSGARD